MHPFCCARRLTLAFSLVLLSAGAGIAAQDPAPSVERTVENRLPLDARGTRQALMELLRRHPPAVGRVLKLDPSLMRNEAYLAAYPELRQFLAAHPEVLQNASFFLEPVEGPDRWTPDPPQLRIMEGTLAGVAILAGISLFLGTLAWALRTIIDQRRWNRLSRIQAEVHTKLMDRFSSNDELLRYVQMPAGQRFLESGPSPLPEGATVAAPFARILWSVQIGAVLLVAGLGLLFLSARTAADLRDFFFIFGCLGAALGAGFVVSAGAAYALSRRLGLLERPVQTHA